MAGEIDVGGIIADLTLDTGDLERGLANARKAMDQVEREIKALQKDFDGGRISATNFGERLDVLKMTGDALAAGMVAAYASTNKLGSGLEIVGANAMKASAEIQNLQTVIAANESGVYELADSYDVLEGAIVTAKSPFKGFATEVDSVNVLLADLSRQETSLIRPTNAHANAIDRENDELNALLATMNRQGISMDKVANGHQQITVSAGKAGKGMAGMGQSMLQSGRIIQDFAQGGLPGILNNFEGFAMAVGLGPGVAGAVTALGVAVYLVGPKVIEFGKQFIPVDEQAEALKGTLGRLEERIETLKDKKVRLAVEQFELDTALAKLKKLQEGQAAWEAAHATRNSAEKKSGQEVAETLAESEAGESAVADRIAATRTKAAEKTNPALAAARANAERLKAMNPAEFLVKATASEMFLTQKGAIKKAEDDAQKILYDMGQEIRRNVGTMMKEAKEGSAGQQKALARDLRASGQGDLAAAIADVSPEKVKAADEEEENARRFGERAKGAGERRRAKAEAGKKADDRLMDDLNEMGKEIEHQTRQESPELFRNPVLVARAAGKAAPGQAGKAAKEEDERFKEAANQVREKIPDIDRRVQEALLADRVRASMGLRPRNTAEAMGKQLIKEGVDKDLVATAVPELRMQGERKIGEATRKAMGAPGGEYEDVGRSQQFGVLDLASRVQGGVGAESKKQTTLQEQMEKWLEKLATDSGNKLTVQVG